VWTNSNNYKSFRQYSQVLYDVTEQDGGVGIASVLISEIYIRWEIRFF